MNKKFKKAWDDLLNKKMDRKEFLGYVGATTLAVTGVSALVNNVVDPSKSSSKGYGQSVYGGKKQD